MPPFIVGKVQLLVLYQLSRISRKRLLIETLTEQQGVANKGDNKLAILTLKWFHHLLPSLTQLHWRGNCSGFSTTWSGYYIVTTGIHVKQFISQLRSVPVFEFRAHGIRMCRVKTCSCGKSTQGDDSCSEQTKCVTAVGNNLPGHVTILCTNKG